MIADRAAPAPSRLTQRCYPWLVIGMAFLTVVVAFGTGNPFAGANAL